MMIYNYSFIKFYLLVSSCVHSPTEHVQFVVVMHLRMSIIWIRRRMLQGDIVKCHELEVEIVYVKTSCYLPVVLFL